jgi:FlaA1/EpsC-like NDP-sugar epimerase
VPTFAQQIEMGGPVTVTHPDMARFFMSIPEAVSLVLQAAALATGNEIFMLEMGDEVSIMELARRMIRLRGLRVNKDIEVTFTGIRPGEKLHEELVYAQEDVEETDHPLIYRLKRSDDALDCETLSSAVSILIEDLHRDGMEQQARDRLLQISCSSVERLVNQAVAWDLAARLPSTDELPSMPLSGD